MVHEAQVGATGLVVVNVYDNGKMTAVVTRVSCDGTQEREKLTKHQSCFS